MQVFHGQHKEGSMMFNEKDLRRICSKEKGVTEQSVMDVLKEDMDGMYDSDMLGSSKIYWSLKSTEAHKRKARAQTIADDTAKVSAELATLKKRKQTADDEASSGMSVRERQDAENKKEALLKQKGHLLAALDSCVDADYYSSLQQTSTIAFDAANRWTDNIYQSKTFMGNLNVEKDDMNNSALACCCLWCFSGQRVGSCLPRCCCVC